MGRGSTRVQFVTCVMNRENLAAPATLLESGDVKVVIDEVYGVERRCERGRPHAGPPRTRKGGHRRTAMARLRVAADHGAPTRVRSKQLLPEADHNVHPTGPLS